jgi:hypothetical protein
VRDEAVREALSRLKVVIMHALTLVRGFVGSFRSVPPWAFSSALRHSHSSGLI